MSFRDPSPVRAARSDHRFALQGRHVLMTMLGFFGIIFAVNGYFLYAALSTHGGVVSVEPYRKGLAYNDRIAADARQQDRGWTASLDVALDGIVTLTLLDRDAAPLAGRLVTVTLGRPATTKFDRALQLAEVAPGRYQTHTSALDSGNWIANADVRDAPSADPMFRIRRRLWLKP